MPHALASLNSKSCFLSKLFWNTIHLLCFSHFFDPKSNVIPPFFCAHLITPPSPPIYNVCLLFGAPGSISTFLSLPPCVCPSPRNPYLLAGWAFLFLSTVSVVQRRADSGAQKHTAVKVAFCLEVWEGVAVNFLQICPLFLSHTLHYVKEVELLWKLPISLLGWIWKHPQDTHSVSCYIADKLACLALSWLRLF